MPTGSRVDPYRNFRFKVAIDGIGFASFAEATIADSTTDPIEYREGDMSTTVRKLSGLTKYGNITLKKGLTDDMQIYTWRQNVEQLGAFSNRRNISLTLVDEEGNDKSSWNIVEAWPTKYDPSDFNAKGNEVIIETLEIVHEGITRVA